MILIYCIVSVMSGFAYLALSDMLLKYEHRKYHSQWLADGESRGHSWESEKKKDSLSERLFSDPEWMKVSEWIFSAPKWIMQDRYAIFILWMCRLAYGILFVSGMCLMGTSLRHGGRLLPWDFIP